MVTGEKPHGGLHPGQIIVGVQSGTLTLEWPKSTHPRVLRLGLACLNHKPEKRPPFVTIMKVGTTAWRGIERSRQAGVA